MMSYQFRSFLNKLFNEFNFYIKKELLFFKFFVSHFRLCVKTVKRGVMSTITPSLFVLCQKVHRTVKV